MTLGVAILMFLLIFACNKVWEPVEEVEVQRLRLVTHNISLDMTAERVLASDFVADLHLGEDEATYTGPVKFEMFIPSLDDPWWMNEWHFECENMDGVDMWVRALYCDPHVQSYPVKARLTLWDSTGRCGWPQDPEFPPEHGEQEEE